MQVSALSTFGRIDPPADWADHEAADRQDANGEQDSDAANDSGSACPSLRDLENQLQPNSAVSSSIAAQMAKLQEQTASRNASTRESANPPASTMPANGILVGKGGANQATLDIHASNKFAQATPGRVDQSQINDAKNRLTRDEVALQHAILSQSAYEKGTAPKGWINISDKPEKLAKYGLSPDDLKIKDSNFSAQVYEPDPAVFPGGSMKPVVAFKGSEPKKEDWYNNVEQNLGMNSPYYKQAVTIGNKLSKKGADVYITGHSLGGGLAAAASKASGLPADTFNASSLNKNTVKSYGGTVHDSAINAYRVHGEILTSLSAPDAKGPPVELEGHGSPTARHRIGQVVNDLEAKIAQDQEQLKQATEMGHR